MPEKRKLSLFSTIARFTLGFVVLLLDICLAQGVRAQDQKIADSLELIHASGDYEQTKELEILLGLAQNFSDTEKKVRFSELLIQKATEVDSTSLVLKCLI